MMRLLFRIFGSLAALLIVFLVIGLLLPGTWSAESTVTLSAAPGDVFPYLNDMERWDVWTPWGDMESTFDAHTAGVGARRSWNHPEFGSGSVTITESVLDRLVRYRVVVGDGLLSVEGTLVLEASEGGSTLTWSETGDFGWNPLLGYTALSMPRSQSAQLERGLAALKLELLARHRDETLVGAGLAHDTEQLVHRVRRADIGQLAAHGLGYPESVIVE